MAGRYLLFWNTILRRPQYAAVSIYNNRFKEEMTNQELNNLLDIIKYVPEDKRDETTNAVLKAAADSLSLEKIKSLTDVNDNRSDTDLSATELKFTKKEISKMPRKFRQLMHVKGMTVRIYRRPTSGAEGHYNYEIRLRSHGYNVYASSNNLAEAKRKFIDKLVEFERYGDTRSTVPYTFIKFAEYYFDNFYKRKVAAETFRIAQS